MTSMPPDSAPEEWTGYAPLPAQPNAGVCSWCGRTQSSELLVVMSGDGHAGICEECVESHSRFFERRRDVPTRRR